MGALCANIKALVGFVVLTTTVQTQVLVDTTLAFFVGKRASFKTSGYYLDIPIAIHDGGFWSGRSRSRAKNSKT